MPELVGFYIAAQIVERVTELFSWIGDKPRAQKTVDDTKQRALWLWIVASVIGVLLAAVLRLGFFSVLGVRDVNPWFDYILSGIALGSGSKPVHDIIAYLEKASQKKGQG